MFSRIITTNVKRNSTDVILDHDKKEEWLILINERITELTSEGINWSIAMVMSTTKWCTMVTLKYYSVEDGEVKIPTYALPDLEICNNHNSYETVDKKATTKSKETLDNDHLKHFQHTNKSFEQIDKNKGIVANANGKMVDEASMREDNESSRKIFTEEKEAVVFCDRGPQYINYKVTGHTSS
ncbi:hypothetical protein BSL78_25371 [Apostichopus japonicus]|uniref:Uncharacterized protein n=1 Tax=Stichopus japonicus TaxID=307972 RepID=A0A2G8JQ41_STIJA|nr:hypothetical protein BSL78_25371 [Apostichopus japonicus]